MNNDSKEQTKFDYNHFEVIGGVLFLITVFIGMAIASRFIN